MILKRMSERDELKNRCACRFDSGTDHIGKKGYIKIYKKARKVDI